MTKTYVTVIDPSWGEMEIEVSGGPDVVTVNAFWDCNCESDYIHNKALLRHCPKCEAWYDLEPSDWADSRLNEVAELYDWTIVEDDNE